MRFKQDLTHRIGLIDEVRGFAILCMVVYHAVYDVIFIFSVDIPLFFSDGMNVTRDLFAFGFIFISGASSWFSHNNLKRGAVCFGIGMGMTAVTGLILPDQIIVFGILHCLGICMMLFPLLYHLLNKLPTWLGVSILLFLFLLTKGIPEHQLGFPRLLSIPLPEAPYRIGWLFPFGFPSNEFFSSDYFPLIPWMFGFFLGGYFGRWLKNGDPPTWLKRTHLRPLAFIGRHTLWIYILHQPILYLAMNGIAMLAKG